VNISSALATIAICLHLACHNENSKFETIIHLYNAACINFETFNAGSNEFEYRIIPQKEFTTRQSEVKININTSNTPNDKIKIIIQALKDEIKYMNDEIDFRKTVLAGNSSMYHDLSKHRFLSTQDSKLKNEIEKNLPIMQSRITEAEQAKLIFEKCLKEIINVVNNN
jgi:hypothetical protein